MAERTPSSGRWIAFELCGFFFKKNHIREPFRHSGVSIGKDDNVSPKSLEDRKEELIALFEENRQGLAGAVRNVIASNVDVVEVLQECFLKAWQALERGQKPKNLKAWLFVVSMNTARDLRRRQRRWPSTSSLEEFDPMDVKTMNPEQKLSNDEAIAAARGAIATLDDKEREVFLLRVSAELSFDAIAESLSIPTGTAKTRMRRALLSLRERLSGIEISSAPARRQA